MSMLEKSVFAMVIPYNECMGTGFSKIHIKRELECIPPTSDCDELSLDSNFHEGE